MEDELRILDQMFNVLKKADEDIIHIALLFSTIEETGIKLTDPRLNDTIEAIERHQKRAIQQKHDGSFDGIDRSTFRELVKKQAEFLQRVLKSDLVCPQFGLFSSIVQDIYDNCKEYTDGKVSTYVPYMAKHNPDAWAVSICTIDGQRLDIGDTTVRFCMESLCKPLNYALAISSLQAKEVHNYVGYEPSGVSCDSISLNHENKPHNPLINSGGIVVASLLHRDKQLADRFDCVSNVTVLTRDVTADPDIIPETLHVLNDYKRMAGGEYLGFCNQSYLSERKSSDRNRALAYFMKECECFPDNTELSEIIDFYLQLGSAEVTNESASVIAATLANGGVCPLTGERVLGGEAVQHTLSLMSSCGLNDYSGQFAFKCSLPAKSGLSGAVLLVVPNLLGVCMWSPRLDEQRKVSARGVEFCKELVDRFNFHIYDASTVHVQDPNAKMGRASDNNLLSPDGGCRPPLRYRCDPRHSSTDVRAHDINALIFSAHNNDLGELRRVRASGVSMQQADYDGRTALHVAAAEGHLPVVTYLVETCHVPLDPLDRWGHMPLTDAERFGMSDVADYLRDAMEEAEHA